MRLYEMSLCYRDSAALLRTRIQALRQEEKEQEDPEERRRLARRIAELQPILTEMRELQRLTAHYYERGYTRNGKYTL